MAATKKTDNDHWNEKVDLRVRALAMADRPCVLDCYHGNGRLWNEVRARGHQFELIGIEKDKGKGRALLRGEAIKHLPSLDLDRFAVIDLDAYGVPWAETAHILERGWRGVLVVTLIQTMQGALPSGLHEYFGCTRDMVRQCQTLFSGNAWPKFAGLLADYGVTHVHMQAFNNKRYFVAKSLRCNTLR